MKDPVRIAWRLMRMRRAGHGAGAMVGILLFSAPLLRAADADVTVDFSSTVAVSRLEVGATHTHYGIDTPNVNATAAARAKQLLHDGVTYANAHIHGWGVGPINE